ncbi:GNAT family N-acetyltransferase [Granulicoccus phenolivorans]|uniref:GNAT family N-acetyltransferase n=1 Tax=Granulicoccus phenolivorans TaxID=266854 RepID=UPI00040B7475|nr:GNAT family N-acetyltransferase [Granulicoccus phenolivorans]
MTHVLDDVTPLTWSTPTQADMSDVIGLVHGIYYFDNSAERMSETEIIESFPSGHPELVIAGRAQDTLLAVGWNIPWDAGQDSPIGRVNLRGGVHPAYRHKGIGRHLLEWQMQMTRRWWWENRGPLETDLEMYTTADAHLTTRRRMYEHAGFQEYRWFFDLHRDLVHELPERCACGAGLRLVKFGPELSEATRQAHNAVFADAFGAEEISAQEWTESLARPNARPSWSWVVVDAEDTVVGYALNSCNDPDSRFPEGWTDRLGVRPDYRHRGIGRGLLVESLRTFAEVGMSSAGLGVDTRPSAHVAGDTEETELALYRSVGYEATDTIVQYQRTECLEHVREQIKGK